MEREREREKLTMCRQVESSGSHRGNRADVKKAKLWRRGAQRKIFVRIC